MSSDSSISLSPLPPPSSNVTSTKRPKQYPPIVVPTGHVSLRILCHASLMGQFIGKQGASIKNLQLETSAKIRVEQNLLESSEFRVILVVAPCTPSKWLKLRSCHNEVDVEVSAVQEAALRVFEKVLEISGEGSGATSFFRVLVDGGGAGCVIGKGGKTVEKLRRESGAKIRVLVGDHLPSGISPPYEIIEIEGDVLAVKKALIGVCGQLQECSQGEKSSIKDCRPSESTSQLSAHDFHANPLHQPLVSMALPTTLSSPALVERPSFEADMFPTSNSNVQQQVVFKILCSNSRAGGVIGRGGSIVKALQEESGATIKVGSNVANCDERLITISSMEDADSRYSPAQRAVVLVFSRSIEAATEKGFETGLNKGPIVSARLLVPSDQIGCLVGKGGIILCEMRKATGASIYILKGDQVPKCAAQDDEVVEISGKFVNTQDALYQVTSRLRDNLFTSKAMNNPRTENGHFTSDTNSYGRVRDYGGFRDMTPSGLLQYSGTSQSIDGRTSLGQGLDPLFHLHTMDHSASVGLWTSEAAEEYPRSFATLDRGFASSNGGVEHGRGFDYSNGGVVHGRGFASSNGVDYGIDFASYNAGVEHDRGFASSNGVDHGSTHGPAIATNTTAEVLVPEDSISSVYGENGCNLARIRQISGAKVIVHEACPGMEHRTVVISGTPDETQAAQSLLHAFILNF